MLSVTCFIQGSLLLSVFLMSVTKQDTWIAVLVGYAIFAGILAFYCWIMKQFPGKTIIEIFQQTLGKIGGNICGLLVVYYMVNVASLNTRDVANFVVGFIMPETPYWAVIAFFLPVCAYAVHSGVETIVRLSAPFMLIAVAITAFHFVFNISEMDFSYFLPMLTLPPVKYVESVHTIVAIIFGEIFVFTMIAPSVSDPSKIPRAMQLGLLVGTAMLLVIVTRDVAVLGRSAEVLAMPAYEAVRLINIGNIFTRTEIFFAIMLLIVQFFKITVLYYASTLALAQIFRLKTYRPIIYALGLLIGVYAPFSFDSIMENVMWGASTAAVFSTFFMILLPAILPVGILARKAIAKVKGAA